MNLHIPYKPGWTFPERCYGALELDINTAPETPKAFPHASLFQLFKELADFGMDIAENGDQP
jgi:hypothetical protein